ncbi:uncharacterized protein LOC135315378 [Phalacrocorax carbo]|uniref:uncharacterized protein LOC135315378 n=1 Tax=Phalacrocorax carbo TaxID=9209 RepID=UPI00311A3866
MRGAAGRPPGRGGPGGRGPAAAWLHLGQDRVTETRGRPKKERLGTARARRPFPLRSRFENNCAAEAKLGLLGNKALTACSFSSLSGEEEAGEASGLLAPWPPSCRCQAFRSQPRPIWRVFIDSAFGKRKLAQGLQDQLAAARMDAGCLYLENSKLAWRRKQQRCLPALMAFLVEDSCEPEMITYKQYRILKVTRYEICDAYFSEHSTQ